MKWQIASSPDKEYIFELAISKGWLDDPQRVQVKEYKGMETWYVIEPYEGECECPFIIRPPKDAHQEA